MSVSSHYTEFNHLAPYCTPSSGVNNILSTSFPTNKPSTLTPSMSAQKVEPEMPRQLESLVNPETCTCNPAATFGKATQPAGGQPLEKAAQAVSTGSLILRLILLLTAYNATQK